MQSSRMMVETKKSSPTLFIDNSFLKGTHQIGDKGTIVITGNISQEDIDTDTDVLSKTVKISKLDIKKFARLS